MAQYEFELPETETQGVARVDTMLENYITRSVRVDYAEEASGTLSVTYMTELEVEVARRALFANMPGLATSVIKFSPVEKVQKLAEIDDGTLATEAKLRRNGTIHLNRRGDLSKAYTAWSNPGLGQPQISSLSGNVSMARDALLRCLEKEYNRGASTSNKQLIEMAATADRMSGEIIEVVRPQLVAVHGLEVQIDRIKEGLATRTRSDQKLIIAQ